MNRLRIEKNADLNRVLDEVLGAGTILEAQNVLSELLRLHSGKYLDQISIRDQTAAVSRALSRMPDFIPGELSAA